MSIFIDSGFTGNIFNTSLFFLVSVLALVVLGGIIFKMGVKFTLSVLSISALVLTITGFMLAKNNRDELRQASITALIESNDYSRVFDNGNNILVTDLMGNNYSCDNMSVMSVTSKNSRLVGFECAKNNTE